MNNTQKQAKRFMNQLQKSEELIKSLYDELQNLKDSLLHITSDTSQDSVQSSSSDKTGKAIAQIEYLNNKINEEIDTQYEIRKALHNAIDSIEDVRKKLLLQSKYINLKSWNEVSQIIGYSNRQTYRLHELALDEVYNYCVKNRLIE